MVTDNPAILVEDAIVKIDTALSQLGREADMFTAGLLADACEDLRLTLAALNAE